MSEIWATLAGGAIALAGSIGSTIFVQSRVPVTEQRNRAQRAADQLIGELMKLQLLPAEPVPAYGERSKAWRAQRSKMLTQISAQSLLLTSAELRERVTFIVNALVETDVMTHFSKVGERWARSELCRDATECIGSFLRGEKKLPQPIGIVDVAKKALADYAEYMEDQAEMYEDPKGYKAAAKEKGLTWPEDPTPA